MGVFDAFVSLWNWVTIGTVCEYKLTTSAALHKAAIYKLFTVIFEAHMRQVYDTHRFWVEYHLNEIVICRCARYMTNK